jgi:hypothetical protein
MIVAAGTFQLNSTTYHVAQWDFGTQRWTSMGAPTDLPGPATAVSVDDWNVNKVFVSGTSDNGQEPYLLYWNGSAWSDVNMGALQQGTGVQQMIFVPIQDDHSGNSVVESNRMLMVSGALKMSNGIGNVSSALFDGEQWHAYLVSATTTGAAGVIASLFYSATGFRLSSGRA